MRSPLLVKRCWKANDGKFNVPGASTKYSEFEATTTETTTSYTILAVAISTTKREHITARLSATPEIKKLTWKSSENLYARNARKALAAFDWIGFCCALKAPGTFFVSTLALPTGSTAISREYCQLRDFRRMVPLRHLALSSTAISMCLRMLNPDFYIYRPHNSIFS